MSDAAEPRGPRLRRVLPAALLLVFVALLLVSGAFDEGPHRLGGSSALGVLILVGAAVALHRWVLAPLQRLEATARALADGATPAAVRVGGVAEVRQVTHAFNAMLARLRATLATLGEREARLRAIVEGLADGVVALDADGRVFALNDAARALSDWPDGTAHGQPVEDVLRLADVTWASLLGQGALLRRRASLRRRDGSVGSVALSVTPTARGGHVVMVQDLAESAALALALAHTEARLDAFARAMPDLGFVVDHDGVLIDAFGHDATRFAVDPAQAIGRPLAEVVGADLARRAQSAGRAALESGEAQTLHYSLDVPAGHHDFEARCAPMDAPGGQPTVAWIVRDVTEQRRAEAAARRHQRLLDRTRDSVYILEPDNLRFSYVNRGATQQVGYARDELLTMSPLDLVPDTDREAILATLESLRGRESAAATLETTHRRKDGVSVPVEVVVQWVHSDEGGRYVAVVRDIRERKEAQARIEQLAFYDPLTGLPNRRLLFERLEQEVARTRRSGHHGALLYLDLDHFKTVNDALGHDVGDHLLREVARRLETSVRVEDTAARLGGDEFVVLLTGLPADRTVAAPRAQRVAEKLLSLLAEPVEVDGHPLSVAASIGIALFPDGRTTDAADLLRRADTAMYRVKEEGRGELRFFEATMQAAVDRRLAVQSMLTRGLDETLLMLHYQPITDARGRTVAAEALLRWAGPTTEPIGALELVQVAEETGQIHALGRFVLRAACAQVARWQRVPRAPHRVAVNVSALQMRTAGFVADVQEALGVAGITGDSLELELTESIFVRDLETVVRHMTALRGLGVRFAIDDFGTGYSSLAYLRRLPIDALKIDRSFVSEITEDAGDAAIVEAAVLMARRLGLSVVAEGVETEAQREALVAIGCTHLQGYLFGRPGPADDIARQRTAPLTHLHSDG